MSAQEHPHTVKSYDEQMSKLRSLMMEMGGMVEDQVQRAIEVLHAGDVEGARDVIARDHVVNALDVRLDEDIVSMLALRQPMGPDLRAIVSVAKAVTDLERIGDEAEKIARMAVRMYDGDQAPPRRRLLRNVKPMAKQTSEILREALDAFARLDVEKAVQVAKDDEELDQQFQAALRELMTYIMEDPRVIGQAMNVVWIVKALERIGDHSKNIGEYVVFLVKGKNVRHVGTEMLAKDVLEGE